MNEVFIGNAVDNEIRYTASSGGIITSVIQYLFESKWTGTYLGSTFDQINCRYVPKFIYSFEQYELTGSIYQDMDIVAFIKAHISEIKGRILVVCSPCQVKVIRHILNSAKIDSFIIDYFCSGQTIVEGTYFYYKALGIERNNVSLIRYRGKGWPNGIEITLKDGTVIKKDNYMEPWVTMHRSRLFTPKRCIYCHQVESVHADLSVGDPWLKEYLESDKIGNSLFIIHSKLGMEVISSMASINKINISHVDYELYVLSQKPSLLSKSNIKEEKDYFDMMLKISKKEWYYKWATSNVANMRKHIWFMTRIIRPYFHARKMNTKEITSRMFEKIFNKIKSGGARWYWKNKLGAMGKHWCKDKHVTIQNPQCLFFGDNVGIGKYTYFMPCCKFLDTEYHPKITIGDGTWIGIRNSFAAIHGITIGKNVLFAGYVHVTDHSHGYEDVTKPISKQPLTSNGPVVIEDNCWLGFNSEILSGVHIGRNSVVAAHAVVTKDVPPYSIVAGNPAKIVKQYNFETHEWERYKK